MPASSLNQPVSMVRRVADCQSAAGFQPDAPHYLLVHLEHVEAGSGGGQDYLLTIQHERFRWRRKASDLRVPNRRTGLRVPCGEILAIVGKQQSACWLRQRARTFPLLSSCLPDHLACFVIDGVDEGAVVHAGGAGFATEAHRSASIGFQKVVNTQRIRFVNVEQACIR